MFRLPGQAGQSGNQQTVRPPEFDLPPAPSEIRPSTPPPPPASAGEFTRLFRTQPSPNPPGDFSGSSGMPKPFPSPELPPEPAAPRMNIATGPVAVPHQSTPSAPKGPGEYTRVMQTPSLQSLQSPPPPPPPASPSPASAQAVQIPISVTPPAMPSAPSMPSVPAPPALPTPQVPYVQASIPVPQAPSVQAPNVQVPAPAPRSGISPAILLLGGLILVAVILVLIFALRR